MNWLSDDAMDRLRSAVDLPDLSGTNYRLVRKLASGGMSSVYLAEDLKLRRKVAIKVMTDPGSSGELASRMQQEAGIVAQLEHPGIVPVHDVGFLPDGRVYYAMKFVQGRRLDQYVREGPALSDLLRVFQKICEAVAFAHAYGVIHRDLKPENIMLGSFGEVMVMDWGVAKVLIENADRGDGVAVADEPEARPSDPEEVPTLVQGLDVGPQVETAHGSVIGTPAYMAPEQARGEIDRLDERTDVYALGAILYFMLTGRPPFASATAADIRQRFLYESVTPPRKLNRKIPRPLEAVCLKALSKEARDRYAGARQLSGETARFLDGLSLDAYRENVFERAGRFLSQNQFIAILVLVYLLARVLVAFFARR
jgi:eukaryotic-like serine/threonine-protein kinase